MFQHVDEGERVVVPGAARGELLKQIHNLHLRVIYKWLPQQIAGVSQLAWHERGHNHVSTCEACRVYMSHDTPSMPWQFVRSELTRLSYNEGVIL